MKTKWAGLLLEEEEEFTAGQMDPRLKLLGHLWTEGGRMTPREKREKTGDGDSGTEGQMWGKAELRLSPTPQINTKLQINTAALQAADGPKDAPGAKNWNKKLTFRLSSRRAVSLKQAAEDTHTQALSLMKKMSWKHSGEAWLNIQIFYIILF